MIYPFMMDPGLRGHSIEADVTLTRSDEPDTFELECNGVWMVRGARRRRLTGNLGAKVEDSLVERTPDILQYFRELGAERLADVRLSKERGE